MEMTDKLDRKEFFMQNKERKWLEIEKILEEYVEEDDELRDKLLQLRVSVTASSSKKISNVVQENDGLKQKLDSAHQEIGRLRKQLLTIGMGSLKTDSNGKLTMLHTQKVQLPMDLDKDPDFIEEYDEEEDYQEDEDQSFDDKILEGFHKDTEEEEVEKNKKAKKKRGGFPSLGFGGKGGANAQQHKANKKSFMSTAPLSAFF